MIVNKILTISVLLMLFVNASYGTWSQQFYEDGRNGIFGDFSFNALAVKVVVGKLQMPTISISDVTWLVMQEDPTTVSASGDIHTPGDLLYLTLNFSGNPTDGLVFDYVAFDGQTMVQKQRAWYDRGCWNIGKAGTGEWSPTRNEIVEPSTIAILGIGALCLFNRKKMG